MHLKACYLLLITASACLLIPVQGSSDAVEAGDFWDTEEHLETTQSQPVTPPEAIKPQQTPVSHTPADVGVLSEHNESLGSKTSKSSILGSILAAQRSYYVEGVFALLAAWFVAGIFTGKEANKKIIKAWVDTNLSEGGVLERNFAQLGSGDGDGSELMMRENPKLFKFWASGRRYCQGLKAELLLQPRQDLLMRLIRLVSPTDDRIDIEVPMNEGSMPLVVLAVATPKLAREMQRELEDVHDLTHRVDVSRNARGSHHWATDKFVVLAEHSGLVSDLIPDTAVEHIFSRPAFSSVGKYFRYLHVTSELPGASNKRMLRFCFQLPAEERMDASSTLMSFVMVMIDIVGNYKLTADQKKRAEKARSEVERRAWKNQEEDRNTKIQERKEKKQQEELERAKKAGPAAYAKFMEKREKIQQKRNLGKLTRVVK
ncbi:hypothetical protein WJX74_001571 [Apatococcus lobatus]|uniref:Coiled-coil domain-containing protein 47 n=1 Tax=Apatococcus lobatus TaxID=904363 RepID=A0AAW1QMR5_9CHLO